MNRNRASILFFMGFVVMAGFLLPSGLLVQLGKEVNKILKTLIITQ